MRAQRISKIVDRTNALSPDIILLLGDYVTAMPLFSKVVPEVEWALALSKLKAPLGVHGVLGNHDWWEDARAQETRAGPVFARTALEEVGIHVYENDAVKLAKDGVDVWVAGLGDQRAFGIGCGIIQKRDQGVDDLAATLSQVSGEGPVLLMAHEPDIFPEVPDRVSVTLSGHTHGGQVRMFGYAPFVPSRFGNRYIYGHVAEERRDGVQHHLVVSGGLGCSVLPMRIGAPPEIVLLTLGVID